MRDFLSITPSFPNRKSRNETTLLSFQNQPTKGFHSDHKQAERNWVPLSQTLKALKKTGGGSIY